ncbi:MAG: alpha-glucosidase C-terminal domain-containing protein [Candidatus Korobacteraceae bacterium]
MKTGNWKRDFRRSAINSLCALMVVFTFASTRSAAQSLPNQWWKTQGTFLFLFTPDPNTGAAETFAAVQAALPRLYSEGIRNIQIYGPYEAGTQYSGLDAINWLASNPSGGTMMDFTNLVNAAHAQGVAVTTFFALEYVNPSNTLFTSAQGNPSAPSYPYFIWEGVDPKPSFPAPFSPLGTWDPLGVWDQWGLNNGGTVNLPSTNFGHSSFLSYCATVINFWLAAGVDGFEFDDAGNYPNASKSAMQQCVTGPANGAGNKLLTPEGAGWDSRWITYGFNVIDDYSIWGTSILSKAITSHSPTNLEGSLKANRDVVVAGGGVTAVGLDDYGTGTLSDAQQFFEMALASSWGTIVLVNDNCQKGTSDSSCNFGWESFLSAPYQEYFFDLLNVQNENPALGAAGARQRVPTNNDSRYYAYLRTSTDGSEKVLVVTNFRNSTQSITVNLSGLNIPNQTPVVLMDTTGDMNINGPAITGTNYTVSLPAYGFAFYRVSGNAVTTTTPLSPADGKYTTDSITDGRTPPTNSTRSGPKMTQAFPVEESRSATVRDTRRTHKFACIPTRTPSSAFT